MFNSALTTGDTMFTLGEFGFAVTATRPPMEFWETFGQYSDRTEKTGIWWLTLKQVTGPMLLTTEATIRPGFHYPADIFRPGSQFNANLALLSGIAYAYDIARDWISIWNDQTNRPDAELISVEGAIDGNESS